MIPNPIESSFDNRNKIDIHRKSGGRGACASVFFYLYQQKSLSTQTHRYQMKAVGHLFNRKIWWKVQRPLLRDEPLNTGSLISRYRTSLGLTFSSAVHWWHIVKRMQLPLKNANHKLFFVQVGSVDAAQRVRAKSHLSIAAGICEWLTCILHCHAIHKRSESGFCERRRRRKKKKLTNIKYLVLGTRIACAFVCQMKEYW